MIHHITSPNEAEVLFLAVPQPLPPAATLARATPGANVLDDLFLRLSSGDLKARDEIITALYPTAARLVRRRLRDMPGMDYFRDELEGVALLTLTEVVDGMRGKPANDHGIAYVTSSMRNAINAAIVEEDNPAYSARYQQEMRRAGEELEKPTFQSLDGFDCPEKLSGSASDLMEVILSCCQDDIDRQIIELFAAGNSGPEVAAAICDQAGWQCISESTVYHRRAKVQERLYTKQPELRQKEKDEWKTRRAG